MIDDLIKGADVSSLLEVEENGGRFFDEACRDGSQPSASFRSEQATGNRQQATGLRQTSPACRGGGPASRPVEGCCRRQSHPDDPTKATGADEAVSQPVGADAHIGPAEDLFAILRRRGVNLIRLRLWNHPYSEDGKPYGAGTNDLDRTMVLARRCKALGLPWLLDFHYSDFWADPGKQYPPKAWEGLDADRLEQAVYDFTRQSLETLREAELLPAMIAPGNELSNGLLWPLGKTPNWENVARFVSAGIRAARAVAPELPIMLHLDNGGNNALYREWFDRWFANGGADFDCIGLSYYPFWHGALEALRANMTDLASRYGKPMIVTETSMSFTLEECNVYEGISREEKRGLAANERTAACVPYPCTPEGQSAFLRDLWGVIRSVPGDLGRGFVWWEPAWLPVKDSGWTTPEGLAYVREKGPGGNEWANQAMFDYEGRALPILETLEALH